MISAMCFLCLEQNTISSFSGRIFLYTWSVLLFIICLVMCFHSAIHDIVHSVIIIMMSIIFLYTWSVLLFIICLCSHVLSFCVPWPSAFCNYCHWCQFLVSSPTVYFLPCNLCLVISDLIKHVNDSVKLVVEYQSGFRNYKKEIETRCCCKFEMDRQKTSFLE